MAHPSLKGYFRVVGVESTKFYVRTLLDSAVKCDQTLRKCTG